MTITQAIHFTRLTRAVAHTLSICVLILAARPVPALEACCGRLFFSPEERAAIDRDRAQARMQRLDGEFRRGGARRLSWVDGQISEHPPAIGVGERQDKSRAEPPQPLLPPGSLTRHPARP